MRRHLNRAYTSLRASPRRGLEAAFYVTAALIASWALLVLLRSQLPDHADGLWVLSFAHDILHHIPLRGWRLPGAPIYFPELFSVLVSGSLGLEARATLLIHGFCSWLLIGVATYWGLRLGRVSAASALRLAFLTLLLYLLLHGRSVLLQPFEYPFSHGGAVLASLFGLLYLAHGFERGFELRRWLGAVGLLALACASDRVLLAHFVAPALALVLLFWLSRARPRPALRWALGLLLLGPLLGQLLTQLIRWGIGIKPGPYSSHYGWAKSGQTLLRVWDDAQQLALDRPLFAASVILPTLFLCWRALVTLCECARALWHRGSEGPVVSAESWLACGAVAMLGSTLAAVVVTNLWDGPASFRYLLPIFLLPLALAVVVAAPRCQPPSAGWARLCELSLLFLLVLIASGTEKRTPRRSATLDSPARACLDRFATETGLRAGYAEYWSARPPMLLSQAGITLAQVSGRLAPKWWADNRVWYTRGFWPGPGRPRFSFVITQRLDKGWLRERFGPPRAEHACFGFEIWVYDRPEDVEFRNYLRSGVARTTGDDPDWWRVLSEGADADDTKGSGALRFGSGKGVTVPLPRVHANVLEIVSPTRRRLQLSYRQGGTELAVQDVTFSRDSRRLVLIPPGIDLRNVDTLFISGAAKTSHEVKGISLMWDPAAERN